MKEYLNQSYLQTGRTMRLFHVFPAAKLINTTITLYQSPVQTLQRYVMTVGFFLEVDQVHPKAVFIHSP
jgi:hypothetical protein